MLSMRSKTPGDASSVKRRVACVLFAVSCVSLLIVGAPTESRAQATASGRLASLDPDTIRATVFETADIINREYMDAAVAARIADALRLRFNAGAYAEPLDPNALASRLTRVLFAESQD